MGYSRKSMCVQFFRVSAGILLLLWSYEGNHSGILGLSGSGLFERRMSVPLEDVSRGQSFSSESENIRQILRIIEQHYVQRERLNQHKLVTSGFAALRKIFGSNIELPQKGFENAGNFNDSRTKVFLCSSKEKKSIQFCNPTQNKSADLMFSAKQLEDKIYVRVGNKVFYSSQNQLPGLRYVENFSRVISAEIARVSNVPLANVTYVFLNGMLDELDPHSSFLNLEEYRDLRGGTRGQFGGVGLVIDEIQDLPVVREIVPNSPAHMAGIKPGDILLRVGSRFASFSPVDTTMKDMRELTLDAPTAVWLYRPSSKRVYRVYISREEIPTRSVETRVVVNRPDVLHLRVNGFSNHTAEDIFAAYELAVKNSKTKLKLFILDLRGNPGGLLDQAIQVSDLFIKTGKIVSTRSRFDEQVEQASRGQKIDLPLVALVNSSSASASEIVVGALRDHGRALIVGERTFGKGSVQSLFELPGGTALKLTIAHYFTPSGRSIQSTGIEPHVRVGLLQVKNDGIFMSGSSESDREEQLAFHLDNPEMSQAPSKDLAEAGIPLVWSSAQQRLDKIDGLDNLNFSYPTFENMDSLTDLKIDSVTRVALALSDSLMMNHESIELGNVALENASRETQLQENILLKETLKKEWGSDKKKNALVNSLLENYFAEPISAKISIGPSVHEISSLAPLVPEKVRPVINELRNFAHLPFQSETDLNTCCASETYVFQVNENALEASGTAATGFVSMRLDDARDGAAVWAPANMTRKSEQGVWKGNFKMPLIFRTYLSSLGQQDAHKAVNFMLKSNLSKSGIAIGSLPISVPNMTKKPDEIPVFVSLTQFINKQNAGSTTDQVKIQVRIPGETLSKSEKFELILIPLVDFRAGIRSQKIPLEFMSTGDLRGEWEINLKKKLTKGLDFDGIVGGILQSNKGEILAKWPLFFVKNGKVETIVARNSYAETDKKDE